MPRMLTRVLAGSAAVLALTVAGGGIASAADAAPAAQGGTSVWVLPGVDAGALLDPLVQVPTGVLAPIAGVLGGLGGLGGI